MDAKFHLGCKTYDVDTKLTEEEFKELDSFADNLYRSFPMNRTREEILVLGWMYMAYHLCNVHKKLQTMISD